MEYKNEFEAYMEYLEIFPNGYVLSPDSLKEEYANTEYITSIYKQCVKEHKTVDEVVPKDHFIQYPPGVEI